MDTYLGATYINNCQQSIMNKTPETFPDPDMPTTICDTGVERPKTEADMTYLGKNNIDETTHQKLSKKDVYENEIHNIYNIIVGHINKQTQE